MYLPNLQALFTGALALSASVSKDKSLVAEGSVLDYCNNECIDDDGNTHCTKPFLIEKSKCYTFEWKTEGTTTHTTMEMREVKDNKNVLYYKDINGDWTAEKSGLVYLDFVPRIGCNSTVGYKVSYCE